MTTMLCKIESWPNRLINHGDDREEARLFGTIPNARRDARKMARKLSMGDTKRDFAISTHSEDHGWVNYEVFREGYEVSAHD